MLDFHPISLADKERVRPILQRANRQETEYSFSSLYMWGALFGTELAVTTLSGVDYPLLFIRSHAHHEKSFHYIYPVGIPSENVPWDLAYDALWNDAKGNPFTIGCIPEGLEPGPSVLVETYRNAADYIYNLEDLRTLKGKKYQPKRNHLSAFLREYPQHTVEPLTPALIPECLAMNTKWCAQIDCTHTKGLPQEMCAGRRALHAFEALGLEGLLVRVAGEIVAYTVGDRLNANTYIVHIEKAFPEYRGAYQVVNQRMADFIAKTYPEMRYVNREDDNGDEGLRQAKLSYHPAYILEKRYG